MSIVKRYLLILAMVFLSGCGVKKEIITAILPSPTPTVTPTAKPTPDIEKLYGPCTNIRVLMYHHVQDEVIAKNSNTTSLTVTPDFFRKQMQYLKDKNYQIITPGDLENFFNTGTKVPPKSVIITFDDGYKDNYTVAYPILKEFGFKATIFISTGHVNGAEYLSWDEIKEMSDLINFGNHTWSHHASAGPMTELEKEIETADIQLREHGLNQDKIFAYPYGNSSIDAETVLNKLKYQLAFTTTYGKMMCVKKKFDLPRIRVGNAPLYKYGLD